MNRNAIRSALWTILACSPAFCAEFHFDARVDVVAAVAVELAPHPSPGTGAFTLRLGGTQDRCLSVSWSAEQGRVVLAEALAEPAPLDLHPSDRWEPGGTTVRIDLD